MKQPCGYCDGCVHGAACQDPIDDSDPLRAVVATIRHTDTSPSFPITVKLARTDEAAKTELQRMINVALQIPGGGIVERGETWARIKLACGARYGFYIQKARMAEKQTA